MTPQLYPYQLEGAAWLAERTAGYLADDMGLGKSAQAIAACDAVEANTVLVICPASVRETWRREFQKFGVRGTVPVVVSYDEVARGKGPDAGTIDVLICDEAHYLKNPKAKRTKAVFGKPIGSGGLAQRATYRWFLSGTPMPNDPSELWAVLRAAFPEAIQSRSGKPLAYWQFVNRYCHTHDNGFGVKILGAKNVPGLKAATESVFLRRKKENVLTDLPPIRFGDLPLDSAAARKAIRDQADDDQIAALLDELDKPEPQLDKVSAHVASLRRITGVAKAAPMADWVKEALDDGLDKIVLMAWHRDVLLALSDALQDYGCVGISGNTSPEARQQAVDAFQNDPGCRVFIGQVQAAGTGLTLTAASRLVFVESSWTPADNMQAAMRVHRIGQRDSVLVQFATLVGSIDERVMQVVQRKTRDLQALFA